MKTKHFLTKDLIEASNLIQKYLNENNIEYISLNDAKDLLKKADIELNISDYLRTIKLTEKTQITGAINYWLDKWRIYRNISITKSDIELSSYQVLIEFSWKRLCKSIKSFAFMSYLIVITIAVGILTTFLGSLKYLDNLFDAANYNISLIGYSVVLSCSATIDFLFMSFDSEEDERYKTHITSIKMLGFTSFVTIILLAFWSYLVDDNIIKIVVSSVLTLLSIIFWWIANARTGKLIAEEDSKIKPSESQSSGGDVNRTLNGSIPKDFKVK